MASETITRNDLTNILNEVLPPTPSEYKKLLWTNPSPTSAFAAQTLSLDLSDYDEVEVEFLHANASDSYLYQRARIGSDDVGLFYASVRSGVAIEIEGRRITVSNTGIVFSDGSRAYNSFTATADNIRCVPTKIYGIKYERVNPPQVEIADCIVEQGTSGSWTYRKWNSGIAECWGVKQFSANLNSQYGGLYWGDTDAVTFPTGLFIAMPSTEASVDLIGGVGGCTFNVVSASGVDHIYVFNGTSYNVQNAYLHIHAIGKWK